VESKGAITVAGLQATGSLFNSGVQLDNTPSGPGSPQNVTVNGSNRFDNNLGDGLEIDSYGAVTLNSITAVGNGLTGVTVRNHTGSAPKPVVLKGSSTFTSNTGWGLSISSLGAITDDHARGYQYLRIAALMRLEPETIRTAQRMVLDGAEAAGTLIGAMGEAGTPAAQHALGELLATPTLGEEPRTHVAVALGLTAAPTRDTLRALDDAASGTGDLASTATLAQGNASLRMHDDDPQAAAAQVDALLARLARASDDEERALVLRALGNTGDPRILDALTQALATGSITVRIAATEALRLVPGSAADQLLLARCADASGLVRAAAVFAFTDRDLGPFAAALARMARRDADVGVRRAIVDLAAARLDELRAVVEQVAANDADPELRTIAKSVLAG